MTRKNETPTPSIDTRKIRQITVAFDQHGEPEDILVEFRNGNTVSVDKIACDRHIDEYRADWRGFTGLFGEPNLQVTVAIGGE
jgi:hypothetical protein